MQGTKATPNNPPRGLKIVVCKASGPDGSQPIHPQLSTKRKNFVLPNGCHQPTLCSRDDVGPHSSVKTVDTKIFPVHGKDFSDASTLSNPNQCRLGKVHRTVGVLAHQLAHSGNVGEIERQKLQHSSLEHFPKSLLRFR